MAIINFVLNMQYNIINETFIILGTEFGDSTPSIYKYLSII